MSEARLGDMAVIDAALINPRSLNPDDIEARKVLIESENDPVTEQPKDQHEAISSPLTEIAKELSPEQQAKAKEEEANKQLLFQQKQQSLLKAKVQATGQSAGRAIGSIQNGLGRVSMPGGLLAPLLVLVVFFFLLVQVNGHTRLTWLWLVATQNAAILDPSAGNPTVGGVLGGTSTGGGGSENNGTGGGMPAVETLPVFVPLDIDEW
jgi:hypothetical protein